MCWADDRVIDKCSAINYVKGNRTIGLRKGLQRARLLLSQLLPWLSRAAFGEALDGTWASFHLNGNMAVGCVSCSRLFPPSQSGPDG